MAACFLGIRNRQSRCDLAQEIDLVSSERPSLARLEPFDSDRADGNAHERHDLMTQAREDATHLAVLPLGQHHFENRRIPFFADHLHALGPHLPFGEPNTLCDFFQHFACRRAGDEHAIELFDPKARVSQAMGERSVVGEQHQANAHRIEPADAVNALGHLRQQVHHARAAGRVAVGRNIPARFPNGVVDRPLESHGLSIDRDLRAPRVDARSQSTDRLAVDRDASLENELFASPTRCDPCVGQHFLKSFGTVFSGRRGLGRVRCTAITFVPAFATMSGHREFLNETLQGSGKAGRGL
jgi:hypothetical protein